jgi:hypothetical protein
MDFDPSLCDSVKEMSLLHGTALTTQLTVSLTIHSLMRKSGVWLGSGRGNAFQVAKLF